MNSVVDQKSKRRETFYQFLESFSIYPIFYSRSPAMEQEKSLSIGAKDVFVQKWNQQIRNYSYIIPLTIHRVCLKQLYMARLLL